MRIAYISTMKHGLPSFVYREIKAISRDGLEIGVFATKYAAGAYVPDPEWYLHRMRPARIICMQPLYLLKWRRQYVHLLNMAIRVNSLVDFWVACDFALAMQRWSADAIHCVEGLHALAIGYYCHKLLNVPLSVTIHNDALYVSQDRPMIHVALSACRFITTVCDYNQRRLIDEFGLSAAQVRVVRLFADAQEFRPDPSVKILIVAQFAQRKGHEILFRAIKALNRKDLRVWVVGGPTWGNVGDAVDVPRLACDLGIADRVTLFGVQAGAVLQLLYQSCDIFCLPSRQYVINEGLPVSLMEAMACGKPVISTSHAGIPELVPEILIDENDVDALAEALAYLADHPEVRRAMGERNRRIVVQHYSAANVTQMQALFTTAVEHAQIQELNAGRAASSTTQ